MDPLMYPRARRAALYPRGRRAVRNVVAVATVAATAAACSSGHKKALPTTVPTTAPPPTAASTTTTVPPTYPLTGLPAGADPQAHRPAVVIKIDNVDVARPQTGLQFADVVYEELVEGGLTRLAAVYQSKYPTDVGPVRSGRLTDEGIADDLNHPVLVFSGANGLFLPLLEAQPVTVVDANSHPEQFRRVGSNIPHNLYSNVASLASLSTSHTAPSPLFTYLPAGQAFGGATATPAAGISVAFPDATAAWSYDPAAQTWKRTQNGTPDVLTDGTRVTAKTVVVYFCNYITSGVASGEGLPNASIPEGMLTGSGAAWFLSDGKIVKGTWSRASLTSVATYKDAAGNPIPIPTGNTWVELAPNGTVPTVTP